MAEEETGSGGGGGGALGGTVTLPGVGPVKKKVVVPVAAAAAAFVLWRYWQARQAAADVVPGDSDGDGYADAGTLPSVEGAVRPGNDYGIGDGSGSGGAGGSTDSYGFTGTTNSQWTQYASTQLSAASDRWSYGDVLEALGQYLANKPLTSTQQQIVQAAIAAAGPPPEGTHPVIPGGDTPVLVAPHNLRAWNTITSTSIGLQWDPVAGATHYRILRSDLGDEPVGDSVDTKFNAAGLQPNKSYSFQVVAMSAANKIGPKSNVYTAKTKGVTLAKPSGVKISGVTQTRATVSWSAVPGAEEYRLYVNGSPHGVSERSPYQLYGLAANKRYSVQVAATVRGQAVGPLSGPVTFTTKK